MFIAVYRVHIPAPVSLSPENVIIRDASQYIASINKNQIYQEDLFDTYIAPETTQEPQPIVLPVPHAPAPIVIAPPHEERPHFLEPLNVTVTGIMLMGDPATSRVIILDNVTKQEVNYKIGDEIEDAQIMRIFKDRILIVRSNGQQESIFLTTQAAAQATQQLDRTDWSSIVMPQGKHKYLVDVRDFVDCVKTIGEFIELADLATAYMQGHSIGCKVGVIQPRGLIAALGLQKGDIITAVEGHPVYTATQRLGIAKKLAALPMGSTITVEFMRQSVHHKYTYVLGEINRLEQPSMPVEAAPSTVSPLSQTAKQIADEQEQEKIHLLEHREQFAPTLQEIERSERQRIMNLMKKKNV